MVSLGVLVLVSTLVGSDEDADTDDYEQGVHGTVTIPNSSPTWGNGGIYEVLSSKLLLPIVVVPIIGSYVAQSVTKNIQMMTT